MSNRKDNKAASAVDWANALFDFGYRSNATRSRPVHGDRPKVDVRLTKHMDLYEVPSDHAMGSYVVSWDLTSCHASTKKAHLITETGPGTTNYLRDVGRVSIRRYEDCAYLVEFFPHNAEMLQMLITPFDNVKVWVRYDYTSQMFTMTGVYQETPVTLMFSKMNRIDWTHSARDFVDILTKTDQPVSFMCKMSAFSFNLDDPN